MAYPIISPSENINVSILPASVTFSEIESFKNAGGFQNSVYTDNSLFLSGCVEQVGYVHKYLGGDILDIELSTGSVFTAYQNACFEYSYLMNLHQAKSSLHSLLGSSTASFDHEGQIQSGSALSGSHVELKYPAFTFSYARKVGGAVGAQATTAGNITFYSASIDLVAEQQDYDLQAIVSASFSASNPTNKKIIVSKVFYITPRTMWRFFGMFGGANVVGNLSSYGMYADDSTFELVPTWQHKLQAMRFEDSMYTRTSHYTYELKNNKLRIFPIPTHDTLNYIGKMWFQYYIMPDAWADEDGIDSDKGGVNNMNNLPFENVPYDSIWSAGKHWIRKYALALCKETLAHVRGKLSAGIPIPGNTVALNAGELLSQAKEEMILLKQELKDNLDSLTYEKISETQKNILQNVADTKKNIPKIAYVR